MQVKEDENSQVVIVLCGQWHLNIAYISLKAFLEYIEL